MPSLAHGPKGDVTHTMVADVERLALKFMARHKEADMAALVTSLNKITNLVKMRMDVRGDSPVR